jgi:cytochrome c oxidase subunit 3
MSDTVADPLANLAGLPAGEPAHEDPMSHVPPGSIWPLLATVCLSVVPFGVVSVLGVFNHTPVGWLSDPDFGKVILIGGGAGFLFFLMCWCNQVIREKTISHDVLAQQKDLQAFILLFLCGELMAFAAVFGYFYHQRIFLEGFGPVEGMEFGGPTVAYATFILIFSSVTCEFAHHALQAQRIGMAKFLFASTIVLGVAFLGFQGYEWGVLMEKGFVPIGGSLDNTPAASFASCFFVGTGFHGLHVAIGLVMLFLVLMRLEFGHFHGKRHFAVNAASWYWHFVDIVWVLLFITVYVVR